MRPTTRASSDAARTVVRRFWRFYALCSLLALGFFVRILIGPGDVPLFEHDRAVDFGAFYGGATLAWEGRFRDLGKQEAQRATQFAIQQREHTGWNWYNTLPHPPVVSLMAAPLAALPLRTAYWVWTVIGTIAVVAAVGVLGRRCCPAVSVAAAIVLLSFEPIWDVAWWGQIDNALLLPVAAGSAMLLTERGKRRDVAAGLLLGALALKPIFVPVPFLALAWGRRPAALGMAISGGALAAVSLAAVGLSGVRDYIRLSQTYRGFTGTPYIVEWRMYNVRGQIIRFQLGLGEQTEFWLVVAISVLLGALTVAAAGIALSRRRSPDLALAAVMLGMVLTAYHAHVQSLVYLTVPLAVWIGRSLSATGMARVAWIIPVIAIHGGAMLLRPERPSPSPSQARVETFLTLCMVAVFLALSAWLIREVIEARAPRKELVGRAATLVQE